ncbi:hypothetical protein HAX54_021046 [Datura stramonium]|uniref:Uncharacterized protein n=1 Tax=Datura stramonium TaxID=4076 RepID=A0ABS8UUF7_DATST|nr:hypothetical protein [Datura stramonium]
MREDALTLFVEETDRLDPVLLPSNFGSDIAPISSENRTVISTRYNSSSCTVYIELKYHLVTYLANMTRLKEFINEQLVIIPTALIGAHDQFLTTYGQPLPPPPMLQTRGLCFFSFALSGFQFVVDFVLK